MNLREKLVRLDKTLASSAGTQKKSDVPVHATCLPGTVHNNDFGWCWRNRVDFDLDYQHGRFRLQEFFENNPKHLRLVAKNHDVNLLSLDNVLFIDSETTGLSGGVGTVAFLVGIGYFKDHRFVIEQFFLRRFDEERPLLEEFFRILGGLKSLNGAVVSFNGKAYDIPLLFNRAIFHRLCHEPFRFLHIDILHTARRLWKRFLADCSLSTLEMKILKVSRQFDVPGSLIPEMYFRYLRSADPRHVLPIFYHNQMDILSVVALLGIVMKLFAMDESTEIRYVDWLAMGKVFEAVETYERSVRFYGDILQYTLSDEEKKMALLRLGEIHKKNQNYEQAISAWEKAIGYQGFAPGPYEELAKVYEHRMNDARKAKEYTLRALENVHVVDSVYGNGLYEREKKRLLWRLSRLESKLNRG